MKSNGSWVIMCCALVAFGGFLFGWDSSYINGVMNMPQFVKDYGKQVPAGTTGGIVVDYPDGNSYQITSVSRSLITSLLSLGTFFGALSGGLIADFVGRTWAIVVAATVFIIGCVIQTAVQNVPGLIVGRVIAGLGVGLFSLLAPMYISESAPAKIRGAIIGSYQLMITIGILCSQGATLGTENKLSTAAYRIPIGLQMAWGLILLSAGLIITESPRWLVKKDRLEQAKAALAKLRSSTIDDPQVISELDDIKQTHEYELSLGKASWWELARGTILPRTLVGVLVQMFQQLTGINFIFYYGTQFFTAAGITEPYKIQVATGVVNVVMTIPGIILVEKLGRRKFLLYGAAWMSMCQLIVGSVSVGTDSAAGQNTLVAFTCLFIAGFACTWGPGAWVLIGELFPLKLRAKGMSLATASNWFWNWVIAFVVPYITDEQYGNLQSKIAFVWFGTSLIGCAWTFFFVPETRQHTLEELDEMFEAGVKPWKTASWRPSGHGQGRHIEGVHETPAPKEKEAGAAAHEAA